MVEYRRVSKDGYSNKIADEIHFLIKYLMELKQEGFTVGEMFEILGQVNGSLIEGHKLKEDKRKAFYGFIEDVYEGAKHARDKYKENEEG